MPWLSSFNFPLSLSFLVFFFSNFPSLCKSYKSFPKKKSLDCPSVTLIAFLEPKRKKVVLKLVALKSRGGSQHMTLYARAPLSCLWNLHFVDSKPRSQDLLPGLPQALGTRLKIRSKTTRPSGKAYQLPWSLYVNGNRDYKLRILTQKDNNLQSVTFVGEQPPQNLHAPK